MFCLQETDTHEKQTAWTHCKPAKVHVGLAAKKWEGGEGKRAQIQTSDLGAAAVQPFLQRRPLLGRQAHCVQPLKARRVRQARLWRKGNRQPGRSQVAEQQRSSAALECSQSTAAIVATGTPCSFQGAARVRRSAQTTPRVVRARTLPWFAASQPPPASQSALTSFMYHSCQGSDTNSASQPARA